MAPGTFRNWNGSAFSAPSVVAEPANLDELIEVVRDRDRYPSPVRAAGSFHSLNECFATTGTQVLLRQFDDIRVDLGASTVTVGAAVTMVRLRDALRPYGMQTEVTPEIGNATVGSVACCGTKDASVRGGLAQVSSTVIAVKLVNPQGEVETVSEDSDVERMRVIRSSYGLLGIVFEVTFRIQPAVLLHTDYESFRLNPPPTRAEMFGGADGMLGIALPYVLPLSVLNLLGGFDGMRSDSTIDFKRERRHYFDFTFCAIPMSAWETFVPAYMRFCQDFRRETGFRVTLLSEVYVMSRDDHSLLSPTATEECFTMDVTDTRIDHPHWKEFNRRFNSLVADHGGRPLLNQTKELTRDIIRRMLGSDWERFLAIREEEDPDGPFLNGTSAS